MSAPRLPCDPRLYQITVLGSLLLYGWLALDLEVRPARALLIVLSALGTQACWTRIVGLPRFDPRSALISGLSLCLLLRTSSPTLAVLAAVITISSKFVLRARGKHVFNPTNFGLAVMLLISDRAWVSPGQWGSAAWLGLLVGSIGVLVVYRAERSDVTWAFLGAYGGLLFGRALWLGDPLAIPLHQMQSGALLIFAFFMISDPKTTPDSRAGRILFAALVALIAATIQFEFFRPNGLIWALVIVSPLVPLIDRLRPARRYRWPGAIRRPALVSHPVSPQGGPMSADQKLLRPLIRTFLLIAAAGLLATPKAEAFCGFYVAKADTRLFNQASKVVLVRDGVRTVMTMANDYRGDLDEFAIVIPVSTVLERDQIHLGDPATIDHLDAYTAPRLVEYHDPNPCAVRKYRLEMSADARAPSSPSAAGFEREARKLGVKIEAEYTVGEYDILILSARESSGLETWLKQNGYRMPPGAGKVLASYIKQDLRFFVAKVNLEEQQRLGYSFLRPLQIAFESPRFMLPIRLGTVNADGPQELFVFVLNRSGRVETTNYRTVKLPTGAELPTFVKADFARFYRDMFTRQVEREKMRTVFLEYAWDMNWCDPCAADPLSDEELRQLGVFWNREYPAVRQGAKSGARDVFVTRLHLRYTAETFPEDLRFQETGDRTNFQGRYVIRHPWRGGGYECPQLDDYRRQVRQRQEREAETLAELTGWDVFTIRDRIDLPQPVQGEEEPWWKRLWGSGGR